MISDLGGWHFSSAWYANLYVRYNSQLLLLLRLRSPRYWNFDHFCSTLSDRTASPKRFFFWNGINRLFIFLNVVSFKLDSLFLAMFNSFVTLFAVRTVELLEIVVNRSLHLFIVYWAIFSILWRENNPRGPNLSTRVQLGSHLNFNPLILAIAITYVWTGALSWWNILFLAKYSRFFLILSLKRCNKFA